MNTVRLNHFASGICAIVLLFSLATGLFAASYTGKRVRLTRADGTTLDGLVVEEEGGRIRLQRQVAIVWVSLEDFTKVEVLEAPEDLYAERSRACKTADDWVALHKWCLRSDIDLPERARECLEKAIGLDPEHAEARRLRGDLKIGGKWYPEEEGNELLGRVKYKGRWITRKEHEREKQREAYKKNRYVNKFLEQQEERTGRPWATVEPIETTNYLVKCNSTPSVAKRYSQLVEDLYYGYDQLFDRGTFPRYLDEKGTVYIFRNHDEFMDFTLYGSGIGGFYSQLDRGVRAYHGSFGITGSTEMVLAHEVTHQFQGTFMKHMRSVPVWLIEGMAVYYGDGTRFGRDGVEFHQIPADRLHTLKEAIRTDRYRELPELLVTPQWAFGSYYDHGWGIIYWCLQGEKHGAHKGEGRRVWDRYLAHVCSEVPEHGEISDMEEHYQAEAEYFQSLLLAETGDESVEKWEERYKDFMMNTLKLEPPGTWGSANRWDGSRDVGIAVAFPRVRGLEPVPSDDLRPEYREVAAVTTSEDLRVWLGVEANWLERTAFDDALEMVTQFLRGYFRREGDYEEEPAVTGFRGLPDIPMVRARFRGRYSERKEAPTFARGVSGEGSDGEPRRQAGRREAAAEARDPDRILNIEVAFILTTDKIYMLCMAGDDVPFGQCEPAFDEFVDSVRLTF